MSSWLEHVKKTMKLNKGIPFKEVLKTAKKTYKKTGDVVKYSVTGKHTKKPSKHKTGKNKTDKRKTTGKRKTGKRKTGKRKTVKKNKSKKNKK